jgi:hypothetical protein
MLKPIPPASAFELLQGGWPADLVLHTVVGSINGLRNSSGGSPADPGFEELSEALTRIQRAGNIGIEVDSRKDGSSVLLVIRRPGAETVPNDDGRRVRELLGLAGDASQFEIVYGMFPSDTEHVAVLTRSMMEIMLHLGFGIDLPAEDVASGRVLAGKRQAGEAEGERLVHIKSGAEAPADTYATVKYKGNWYWIDENDVESKRSFTFLMILFSLAETGQGVAAPVVTVPSR